MDPSPLHELYEGNILTRSGGLLIFMKESIAESAAQDIAKSMNKVKQKYRSVMESMVSQADQETC